MQTTERLADRAFRVRNGGEQYVVYMEAYTYWESSAPWSMLVKSALLSERERKPTVSIIFILRPRGFQSQDGVLHLKVGGSTTQQLWFHEVCLWEHEPTPTWEQIPALMALYPLSYHSRSRQGAITYAAGVIRERVKDPTARGDLLTTLGIFGKLAYPQVDAFQLIGGEQMRESKFYQEIMEEGRLEGIRKSIAQVLATRFGSEAVTEVRQALEDIIDEQQLSDLLDVAAKCRRPADFRRSFTLIGSHK